MLKVTVDRPTNTTDSVSLVREWLYNRRSELAAATGGRVARESKRTIAKVNVPVLPDF